MSSSKITQVFRKSIFPSHFINCRVRCLQSPSLMLRNSRPDLFQSSFSRNFTNAKDAETGHETEAVAPEGPKKKLATSLRELIQKNFVDISKKLKDPVTPPIRPGKNIWIVIRDNWKQFLGIGILTDFLFALVMNKVSEYRVNLTLENGTRPKSKVLEDEFVPRPQISETLRKVFQPNERQSYYYVICGEHGTGKTTLTRIEATNVGKGVIYVDILRTWEKLLERLLICHFSKTSLFQHY
ncbi:1072_t:CDS:1 [Scutellospora calospora]|uniref:1072_t:CDS:1 n=1 Tax=Scutellospora calospora TaxID=85575 RepID=A0ACA9KPC5_9GLOM|nr:1072_t:CDS:1 [Scutellospora calospora]